MGEISDVEELLDAYRTETRRGKRRPVAWALLVLLGTGGGSGGVSWALQAQTAKQSRLDTVDARLERMEEKLDKWDRAMEAKSRGETDQDLRIGDAQSCCNHLSTALANHLNPRRRISE